ncbi:MAG: hypothetical protein K0Q94_4840 [Paenibacillus sp.]|uniref:S-layer homology domain-containing protein n=1 Tax=Paenibacillus sp. GCM10012303 TaxID=3317340 RepID=UPI0029EDBD5E|nr:hypothetical protein [Paenibacillus sp.]
MFQRLKRLSATLLVASMLSSGWSSAYAADAPKDSQRHWAQARLSAWLDQGYIQGYEDGSLRPDDSIKRGELFALINRVYGWKEPAAISFADLTNDHWAYAEAAKAVKAGYIEGYEDNSIRVEASVSRQELAVIVTRLLRMNGEENGSAAKFADAASIPDWSRAPIGILAEHAIVDGYEDGVFRPAGLVTRAEAVVMLDRASSSPIYHKPGVYGPASGTETIKGNIQVTASGVTLQNMKIEGDLILAAGIGKGDVTLKNVTVTGTTRILGGGVNSVHLVDTVLGIVSVNNTISTVRIVLKGTASIQEVSLHTAAIIVADEAADNAVGKVTLTGQLPAEAQITLVGSFEAVHVLAQRILLEIPKGSVSKLTIDRLSGQTKLVIGKEANLLSLIIHAAVSVFGEGNVQLAVVNAPGAQFEKQPQRIEIGSDATAQTPIKIGDKELTLGDVVKPLLPVPGPSAGSGSDDDDEIVPPPGTFSPRSLIPLEGSVTESVYVNQLRIATVGDTVYGIADQRGFLYLVPGGTDRYISMLDYMVAAKQGQRAFGEANQKVSFHTAGLPAGDYVIVALNSYYLMSDYSPDQEIRLLASPETPLAQNSVQVYSNSRFVDIGFNKPIRNARGTMEDLGKSVTYSTYKPTGTVTSYTYEAGDTIEIMDSVIRFTFAAGQPDPITLTLPAGTLTDDRGVPLASDVTVSFEFGPSLTVVNPGAVQAGSPIAVITDKAAIVYLVKRGGSATKSDLERAIGSGTAKKVETIAGQEAFLPTDKLAPGEYVVIAWGGSSASIIIR